MNHDKYLWHLCRSMQEQGIPVAWEVGVPDGRVDLVRVDSDGVWREFYEAKVRAPEAGISQLHRYRRAVGLDLQLTLVVPASLDTLALREQATVAGVRVMRFDARGLQERLFDVALPYVALPYHWQTQSRPHPSSLSARSAPTALEVRPWA